MQAGVWQRASHWVNWLVCSDCLIIILNTTQCPLTRPQTWTIQSISEHINHESTTPPPETVWDRLAGKYSECLQKSSDFLGNREVVYTGESSSSSDKHLWPPNQKKIWQVKLNAPSILCCQVSKQRDFLQKQHTELFKNLLYSIHL